MGVSERESRRFFRVGIRVIGLEEALFGDLVTAAVSTEFFFYSRGFL